MVRQILFIIACWILLSAQNAAVAHNSASDSDAQPYNEMESRAPRRFAEQQGVTIYPPSPKVARDMMGMPLGDAIKILPIPAVLTNEDYTLIQTGAQLRARTIVAAFADIIFNGAKRIRRAHILTDEQISLIFHTENQMYDLKLLREIWKNRSVRDIGMVYGPDVVRNSEGNFRVLEDNLGLIGGVGDVAATHNAFFESIGLEGGANPPLIKAVEKFLVDIPRDNWKEQAVILYRKADHSTSIKPEDAEDKRIHEAAQKLDIPVMDSDSLKQDSDELKTLVSGKIKKVINLYSPYDMPGHTITMQLLEAFAAGKIDLFVAPGIDALGSKAMLPFIDRLTRLFLGENSRLLSQSTYWITSPEEIDGLDGNWVVKKANGRQGSQVYLMNALTTDGRKNLKTHIEEWMSYYKLRSNAIWPMFIRQERLVPSVIPAGADSWVQFNVDYRPHVFVVAGEPMNPVIWGRASLNALGTLNNVSQTAMELVVTTPNRCERELMR